MSTVERNKGKLIPTGIYTHNLTQETIDTHLENGFVVVDKEMYKVEWEVHRELDCSDFADVSVNPDTGVISFHTMHYNGGVHWTEVVQEAL